MRIWEKEVGKAESGKSLEKLLREEGFTKKEISRMKFREKGMTVDGRKCRSTEIVKEGQKIVLFLDDEHVNEYPRGEGLPQIKICYEDADILILDKESGISSHPGRGHYGDSLGGQAAAYLHAKGENNRLRLIGRLDKDTSGAVVFAKNQAAAARLWKQRDEGVFQKTYQALVHGELENKTGEILLPMEAVPDQKNRMRVSKEGTGLAAQTFYKVKEVYDAGKEKISLVECTLGTGRTHQIRVHMAAIGHPVLGDPFYGCQDEVKRLCLHAEKVKLRQPFYGKDICVEIFSPFCQLDLDYLGRSL